MEPRNSQVVVGACKLQAFMGGVFYSVVSGDVMTACITAGDGTQPVWANLGKKAVCRELHGGEENAEAGQGSRLLPLLPRSPGGRLVPGSRRMLQGCARPRGARRPRQVPGPPPPRGGR